MIPVPRYKIDDPRRATTGGWWSDEMRAFVDLDPAGGPLLILETQQAIESRGPLPPKHQPPPHGIPGFTWCGTHFERTRDRWVCDPRCKVFIGGRCTCGRNT